MRKYVDHKFWQYISKTNTVKVIPVELFEFLSQNGFKYHTLGNTGVDVPVEVEGKFIVLRIMNDLKKFTIEYIKTQDFPLQLSKTEQKLIVNALIISNDLFLEKYLQFLDPYNPNIIGDDQYVSRVYFKNKYIEITRDKVHPKEYIELEGAVYKSEIIDFAIDDTILFSDYKDSDFYIFLGCICDNGDIEVDEDKLTSLKSIIGYLLHTYKDPSFPRAVIFLDPSNEINPNGRTGKGLICKALGHTRKLAKEDGKFFGVREKYAFSLVEWDTNNLQ